MSASPETDLFDLLAEVETEDPEGMAFMAGLSQAGRLHRAAQALAEEAFLLGEHVDEEEAPEEVARLAAQDTTRTSTEVGARYTSQSTRLQV